MPRHKQVTTCRKSGGPVSNRCSCEHCTLAVCSVCCAYEGGLTTDCPGTKVSFDRRQEVYETNLDYTDDRGWHQGASMKNRAPRFEPEPEPVVHKPIWRYAKFPCDPRDALALGRVECTCGWRPPSSVTDSDTAFSMHAAVALAATPQATDWAAIDRTADLQRELARKAIAWVLADRVAEDHSASYDRITKEAEARMREKTEPNVGDCELLAKLEHEKKGFHLADQRAQRCDDEFRQTARKLVAELEKDPP